MTELLSYFFSIPSYSARAQGYKYKYVQYTQCLLYSKLPSNTYKIDSIDIDIQRVKKIMTDAERSVNDSIAEVPDANTKNPLGFRKYFCLTKFRKTRGICSRCRVKLNVFENTPKRQFCSYCAKFFGYKCKPEFDRIESKY